MTSCSSQKWILPVALWLLGATLCQAQVNLVPNHSFEDITDCDLDFGDVPKAAPWQIIPEPVNSPDLYNTCSTSGFYVPPAGCGDVFPLVGDGMVGLVQDLPPAEERIYVRLTDTLPLHKDIYVSLSTIPRGNCGPDPGDLCFVNLQCLAFSDFAFLEQQLVIQPTSVISNTQSWTTLRGCHRANGTEDLVLIGDFRPAGEARRECELVSPDNFAYSYIDEVIVSPFEVVPDTIILCGDEIVEYDATFYDLPISWSDGVSGAIREISEGGQLIAMGRAGSCFLEDTTFVVKIPEEEETIELAICDGEELLLQTPISAVWPNGDTTSTYRVTESGQYRARLLSDCDERLRYFMYEVEDKSCDITYFVPNAFSPNRDGINDQLEFFFESDFNFSGELYILDRWGNLLFQQSVSQANSPARWNGTFNGKLLGAGVYVWAYEYVSGKDGKTRVISGDVALLP
ncbi:MAG: gliding motility-associated C-terminal domain-containing protein [Bacteroidota bacterium]